VRKFKDITGLGSRLRLVTTDGNHYRQIAAYPRHVSMRGMRLLRG
jgi:hypothetical protein